MIRRVQVGRLKAGEMFTMNEVEYQLIGGRGARVVAADGDGRLRWILNGTVVDANLEPDEEVVRVDNTKDVRDAIARIERSLKKLKSLVKEMR
jgi:hypothetical protein